jgi:hypothetical protein
MSELTFNIADYRPLFRAKTHESGHAIGGFVVLSSNSQPREYAPDWYDPHPSVVEIRTVRETHRPSPRRGKILRFSNPASHRLYTMPAPEDLPLDDDDDDPGPLVA